LYEFSFITIFSRIRDSLNKIENEERDINKVYYYSDGRNIMNEKERVAGTKEVDQ